MKIIAISIVSMLLTIPLGMKAQDVKQEKMVTISAFSAKGDLRRLEAEFNAGLDAGLTVNEIKEVIVHTYAYCGFPRAIRGLQTLMMVLDDRKSKGIDDNWGREASPINDKGNKYERGSNILSKLGEEKGRKVAHAVFCPEIDIFLKEHLFADLYERDVLTYAQRGIVTISVLISIGGVDPMIRSHVKTCLNIGVQPDQLKQILGTIERFVSEEDTGSARQILAEVLESRDMK